MGIRPMRARGCIRFSLGIYNTEEEVDYVLQQLPPIIAKLREISPANHGGSHRKHETSFAETTTRAKVA